ncbi:hypothetical protein, partial [Kineococcus sp. NUM-3379]
MLLLLAAGTAVAGLLRVTADKPVDPVVGSSRVLATGVEVFSLWRDWPVNAAMLDRVAASGAGWVRVGVGWCS